MATRVREQFANAAEVENKVKNLKAKLNHECKILDKAEPSFVTLRRISEMAKKENIEGFRGLFIDYVECTHPD
jgi:hypothetical protein